MEINQLSDKRHVKIEMKRQCCSFNGDEDTFAWTVKHVFFCDFCPEQMRDRSLHQKQTTMINSTSMNITQGYTAIITVFM